MRLIAALTLFLMMPASSYAWQIYPDGTYGPDGKYQMMPDGSFGPDYGEGFQMYPNGKFGPKVEGGFQMAPDGEFIPESEKGFQITPDGTFLPNYGKGYELAGIIRNSVSAAISRIMDPRGYNVGGGRGT